MRILYFASGIICCLTFGLLNTITIATTNEEAVAAQLYDTQEDWRIEVLRENLFYKSSDAGRLKADLMRYYELSGSPTQNGVRHASNILIVAFSFSLVGFARESALCRRDRKR